MKKGALVYVVSSNAERLEKGIIALGKYVGIRNDMIEILENESFDETPTRFHKDYFKVIEVKNESK